MTTPSRSWDQQRSAVILRIHEQSVANDNADEQVEAEATPRPTGRILAIVTPIALAAALVAWGWNFMQSKPAAAPEANTPPVEKVDASLIVPAVPKPKATEAAKPTAALAESASGRVTSQSAKPVSFLAGLGLGGATNDEVQAIPTAERRGPVVPYQPAVNSIQPGSNGVPVITGVRAVAPPANSRPQPATTAAAGGLTGEVVPAGYSAGPRLIVGAQGETILLPSTIPAIPVPPSDAVQPEY